MSDLAEIRTMVAEIQKSTAATAEAISWIKTGMDKTAEALQAHVESDQSRLGKLERRQSWTSGASAVIGIIFGSAAEHFFTK